MSDCHLLTRQDCSGSKIYQMLSVLRGVGNSECPFFRMHFQGNLQSLCTLPAVLGCFIVCVLYVVHMGACKAFLWGNYFLVWYRHSEPPLGENNGYYLHSTEGVKRFMAWFRDLLFAKYLVSWLMGIFLPWAFMGPVEAAAVTQGEAASNPCFWSIYYWPPPSAGKIRSRWLMGQHMKPWTHRQTVE